MIIDSNHNKKSQDCEIVFYDLALAFDSLWAKKTYIDLFHNGVKNNTINILSEINKSTSICIKTPVGQSSKSNIEEKIMQGENFSLFYPIFISARLSMTSGIYSGTV